MAASTAPGSRLLRWSPASTSVPPGEHTLNDFLPVGTALYVARAGTIGPTGWNMDGLVGQTTTSGGPEAVISLSEMWPINLQVVGPDLYFLDQSWGKLKRVPLAGGPVVEVFTPVQPGGPALVNLSAFRIRNGELYWADFGASNSRGAVYRTTLATGSTVTLAANVYNIKKFVVDDTGVFWLSQSGSAAIGWTVTLWTVPHGTFVPEQLYQSARWLRVFTAERREIPRDAVLDALARS